VGKVRPRSRRAHASPDRPILSGGWLGAPGWGRRRLPNLTRPIRQNLGVVSLGGWLVAKALAGVAFGSPLDRS